jgi:hypothetical protein
MTDKLRTSPNVLYLGDRVHIERSPSGERYCDNYGTVVSLHHSSVKVQPDNWTSAAHYSWSSLK